MPLNISEIANHLLKDIEKFRKVIFTIVIFTGVLLWFFRFLILWGFMDNPHGRNFWFMDFECYYRAAQNYTIGGEIYGYGFYYPPISIFFFLPFSWIEFEFASLLFTLLNLIVILAIFKLMLKILCLYKINLRNAEKITLFAFIITFYPVAISLTHGQINLIILLLVGIFYYYNIYKNKSTLGAISLNLASLFKLWPISLAIVELFHEKSKSLLFKSFFIFSVIWLVSLTFQSETVKMFILNLLSFQSAKIYSIDEINTNYLTVLDPNASIFNMISKIGAIFGVSAFLVVSLNIFLKILILLIVFAVLFIKSKRIQDVNIRAIAVANLLISTVLILSNVTWTYYFTFLLFSIFFYFYVLDTNTLERVLIFLTISLLSLQEYIVFGAKLIGGSLALLFYIFQPATLAYISYYILSLYSLVAAKDNQAV